MFAAFEVATVMVAAVAMALALAHALEWPGKARLSEEHYVAMQSIYYPGFTVGGIAEPLAVLMMIALAVMTPTGTAAFWLIVAAALSFVGMHAAYWLLTHPVNNFWLKDVDLKGAGKEFFAADPLRRIRATQRPDWIVLRDRWEQSHAVRAGLGALGLVLLVSAVAI